MNKIFILVLDKLRIKFLKLVLRYGSQSYVARHFLHKIRFISGIGKTRNERTGSLLANELNQLEVSPLKF